MSEEVVDNLAKIRDKIQQASKFVNCLDAFDNDLGDVK